MIKCVFAAVFLLTSLWPIQPSSGQGTSSIPVQCFPSNFLENHLKTKFKEARVASGVSMRGGPSITELWMSRDGDTWTITLRLSRNILCIIGSGHDWQEEEVSEFPIKGIPVRG